MISKIIVEELVVAAQRTIQDAESTVIVAHVAPDGDALGSSLGMWHYLMEKGKNSIVIMPSAYPDFYHWMPGIDHVLIYESDKDLCDTHIQAADLIIALDFNTPGRLAKMEEVILNANAKKINIDHHLLPSDFADIIISHPEISSTSELVFRLICRIGDFTAINIAGAECIYTGMMSDTGGFTYNSNDREIYLIISELLKLGVDKDDIYRKVYNTYSAQRLRLMGYCTHEKMKLYPENKAALITLTADEMKQFDFKIGDDEGFSNIPLSIKDVVFSVLMREDPDKIKISLRSEGGFPANKFAAEVFDGGGHLNASGGEFYGSMENAIRLFEEKLDDYIVFLEEDPS